MNNALYWMTVGFCISCCLCVLRDMWLMLPPPPFPHRNRFDNFIGVASRLIQHWAWLIGLVVVCLFWFHFLIQGWGKREVPWLYLGVLAMSHTLIVGAALLVRYNQAFADWFGIALSFWVGRAWRIFSSDNTSANTILALACYLWALVFLQGLPVWGPDVPELESKFQKKAAEVQQSGFAANTWAFVRYPFKGGKIPAIERVLNRPAPQMKPEIQEVQPLLPRYDKSGTLAVFAILLSILGIIDFIISRTDDVGAIFSRAWDRVSKRRQFTVVSGETEKDSKSELKETEKKPESPTPTTKEHYNVPFFWMLLSDFISDIVVSAFERKGKRT